MKKMISPLDAPFTDGVRDFSPYLQELLTTFQSQLCLQFEPGEYHFYPESLNDRTLYVSNTDSQEYPRKKYAILLENQREIRFIGQDTDFIIHGDIGALAILQSEGITFDGIRISYATQNVIDLTVEEIQHTPDFQVTFRFPTCYEASIKDDQLLWQSDRSPKTQLPYWQAINDLDLGQRLEQETGNVYRLSEKLFAGCTSKQLLEDQRIVLTYDSPQIMALGDIYQLRETPRKVTGMLIDQSQDVTFQNMSIHFLNDMGIIMQVSRDLTFEHCHFTPKAGHHSSSGADILHFSGCRGQLIVRDCFFKNPHDDMINVHGTFLKVTAVKDTLVTVCYQHPQTLGFSSFLVGDELLFYDQNTLLPVSESFSILDVHPVEGTLDTYQLRLDQPVTLEQLTDLVVDNISAQPNLLVENCLFERCPTRGILASTSGQIRILNNEFKKIHYAAIFISCDANDWFESGPVKDVLIAGNRFVNCASQAVLIEPTNTCFADQKIHEHIIIRDNQLYQVPSPAFSFKSADQVQLINNQLDGGQVTLAQVEIISSTVTLF